MAHYIRRLWSVPFGDGEPFGFRPFFRPFGERSKTAFRPIKRPPKGRKAIYAQRALAVKGLRAALLFLAMSHFVFSPSPKGFQRKKPTKRRPIYYPGGAQRGTATLPFGDGCKASSASFSESPKGNCYAPLWGRKEPKGSLAERPLCSCPLGKASGT